MSFSTAQIRKLQENLKADIVRTREVHGRQMNYIEGWHAISEANRIFGFDAWNCETVESRCVLSRDSKGTFHTVYVAKVRITVRTPEALIVREGFGTGDAQATSAGEAHDKAIKTAETDATKRALATFGKPFGLSLYLGSRLTENRPPIDRRRTLQKLGPSGRYYVPSRTKTALDRAFPTSANGQETPSDSKDPAPDPDIVTPVGQAVSDAETSAVPHDGSSDSPLLIALPKRQRNIEHLRFVANQPCLVCSRTPSDAHHLKFTQPMAMAKKVSDEFTVPLCRIHHRQLHHGGNEVNWWLDMEIDPLPIAQNLWDQSHKSNGHDPKRK